MKRKHYPHDKHIKVRRLGKLFGTTVWLVDGQYIRDHVSVDFVLGDNWRHSPKFVKPFELWVERVVGKRDMAAILIHEYIESLGMRFGLSYENAHDRANIEERKWRRLGREPRSALREAASWIESMT